MVRIIATGFFTGEVKMVGHNAGRLPVSDANRRVRGRGDTCIGVFLLAHTMAGGVVKVCSSWQLYAPGIDSSDLPTFISLRGSILQWPLSDSKVDTIER